MAKLRVNAGGGFPAIFYTFRKAGEAGGLFKFFARMFSKNACKTCALGMGGQKGGMVNEMGHFPEFCKKSVQAQAADMTGSITEEFLEKTPLRQLSALDSMALEKLGRITFPMIAEAGDTHYRRIDWDEALERAATAFRNTRPDRVFFYSSGRSSNEAAFLMQLVGRAYGTANINNCSFYCHQASGVALNMVYGSGTASIVLEDLEKADFALVIGANPGSNHPRLITQLAHLRKRGGKVIVINPLKELGLVRFKIPSIPHSLFFGSQISDLYLQPRIGTDIALLKAILKGLLEAGAIDTEFIRQYTTDWYAIEQDLCSTSWGELTNICGVPRPQIEAAVEIMAKAERGIMMWAMGLTHHVHGVENILALSNIAIARGWLGKEGCGLLPIRGHSNVQGVGSVGVAPALKDAFARRMQEIFPVQISSEAGYDTYASMQAVQAGKIDAAFMLGGNLYSSNPDSTWAAEAMNKIPFSVYVSTKLNEGHLHGRGKTTLILPALARDEESQATTQESMFNYMRLSEGGKPAVTGEMRSEVEILAGFAERVLPDRGFDWTQLRSHQHLRDVIAQVVPGFHEIAEIETRGEFQIEGRTFHTPKFATPDGKAHFHVTPMPELELADDEFMLMTLRSEGQFNTVVYEEEDLYRGNAHRNVVMLSQTDARRLGLAEGDWVTVKTDAGEMTVKASITEISPGSLAMYYPEANVLVTQALDPRSKTPAFKSIKARLIPDKQTANSVS